MTTPYMTSDDLIESVKRKISLPISQNTFSEDDILAFANEEMMIGQVPSMLQYHEEFFVFSDDVPLVKDVLKYSIPSRAIGMKLRDVFYVDTADNLYEMARVSADDKSFFQISTSLSQMVHKYYCEGNEICLIPHTTTNPSGRLRMFYFIRPNKLVRNLRAMVIQTITDNLDGTSSFIVDKIPTGIVSSTKIDMLQMESGHKLFDYDYSMVSLDTNTKTIVLNTSDIPKGMVVGDYFCSQYECIVPQIPDDLHISLVERTCARILCAQGDKEGLTDINEKLKEIETRQGTLIDNRCDGSSPKVLARHTLLRSSGYNRFRKI